MWLEPRLGEIIHPGWLSSILHFPRCEWLVPRVMDLVPTFCKYQSPRCDMWTRLIKYYSDTIMDDDNGSRVDIVYIFRYEYPSSKRFPLSRAPKGTWWKKSSENFSRAYVITSLVHVITSRAHVITITCSRDNFPRSRYHLSTWTVIM